MLPPDDRAVYPRMPVSWVVISLILTGMNCDGADGAEEIKKMGGKVIAEARSSCVIYGMPGEIVRRKLADLVLPLDEMADEIIKIIG